MLTRRVADSESQQQCPAGFDWAWSLSRLRGSAAAREIQAPEKTPPRPPLREPASPVPSSASELQAALRLGTVTASVH